VVNCFDLTIKVKKHTTKNNVFSKDLRFLNRNHLIKFLEVNIDSSELFDFYHAAPSIELKLWLGFIVAPTFVIFSFLVETHDLGWNVLHFL